MRHTIQEIEYYLALVNDLLDNDYKLKLNRYNGYYHIELYYNNRLHSNLFDGTKNEVYYALLSAYKVLEIKV